MWLASPQSQRGERDWTSRGLAIERGRACWSSLWCWLPPVRWLALASARGFRGSSRDGRSAYERGDWPAAAAAARSVLKEMPDDPEGVRLLARALARQQKDELVPTLFGRLGMEQMHAEDLFLLGSVLLREGQAGPSLSLMESAVKADADHPEAILALAKLYAGVRHVSDAVKLAERLAQKPGWEARGGVALGVLRRQLDDSVGAAGALERALQADPALEGASLPPGEARKLLARWRLESGEPALARKALEPLIGRGDDAEAFWLLSRVCLQESDSEGLTAALAAPARTHAMTRRCPNRRPTSARGSAQNAIYRSIAPSKTAATLARCIARRKWARSRCRSVPWPIRGMRKSLTCSIVEMTA